MTIRVVPNREPVGADVQGLGLDEPLTDYEFAEVHAALDRHGVIYIRGQRIAPARFLDLATASGRMRSTCSRISFIPSIPRY